MYSLKFNLVEFHDQFQKFYMLVEMYEIVSYQEKLHSFYKICSTSVKSLKIEHWKYCKSETILITTWA